MSRHYKPNVIFNGPNFPDNAVFLNPGRFWDIPQCTILARRVHYYDSRLMDYPITSMQSAFIPGKKRD